MFVLIWSPPHFFNLRHFVPTRTPSFWVPKPFLNCCPYLLCCDCMRTRSFIKFFSSAINFTYLFTALDHIMIYIKAHVWLTTKMCLHMKICNQLRVLPTSCSDFWIEWLFLSPTFSFFSHIKSRTVFTQLDKNKWELCSIAFFIYPT